MASKASKKICPKGKSPRKGYTRESPRVKRVKPTCVKRSKSSKRSSKRASKRTSKTCAYKRVANYSKECDAGMMWRRGHCKPSSGKYVAGRCVAIPKQYAGPYLMAQPSATIKVEQPMMVAAPTSPQPIGFFASTPIKKILPGVPTPTTIVPSSATKLKTAAQASKIEYDCEEAYGLKNKDFGEYDVKKAYRGLSLKYHPDKISEADRAVKGPDYFQMTVEPCKTVLINKVKVPTPQYAKVIVPQPNPYFGVVPTPGLVPMKDIIDIQTYERADERAKQLAKAQLDNVKQEIAKIEEQLLESGTGVGVKLEEDVRKSLDAQLQTYIALRDTLMKQF